ncbi:complement component 1 Q subcomponent-binding protein, mitochondrial [Mus musculus]|uniref:Complement component 1 Q subcomponent-binding protein, mitochondrial n=2 Tax=Mus TaxID=862507 RepID=Q8R5L1_MOUSE|nr:complement component 1 Q subcomponent-binding protein, mitochondrial [Mus musculus]AAH38075.1 Complement component 1, q subcomponent binding protein [Mus musculus]AAL77246.1 p32-RACK [Mus musculus]EDL12635.1 complement component 1, q subcomponent binding protein, isoform CRA_b [Mus musculus]|eukprot:NP_031599.2 complement component 1 Q subcomponent-binding protein, mitochondrial [Mus musculus]
MLPLLRCVPRALGAAASGLRTAIPAQPLRHLLQPAPRPCLRPFGLLSVRAGSARRSGLLQPPVPCACGCGALHTEGDKAFVEFLTDEIKEEKKIQKHKSLPKMSGDWELEVNGTEAKLLRKVAGEKITVTFNINNSIPPTFDGEEEPSQGQKAEEQEPELTSTPNFVVEVTKTDGKKTLVLDCHYPEDEIGHEDEAESDIFSIKEVSFQATGDSEWRDTNYTLNTDSLDWALYDHLMDFLADRGVDNTFADELVELSTALEHQEYITFLEDLKSFVKNQ